MGKFRLQQVLDYRQRLEDQARQQLADAMVREGEALSCVTRARELLEALREEFQQQQREGIPPQEFSLYLDHINLKVAEVARLVEDWEAAAGEVENRRQALCEASREKRLLEMVKEKQLLADRKEELRLENIFLDEIAVQQPKR